VGDIIVCSRPRLCDPSRRCAKPLVVVCNRGRQRRRKRRADSNETNDVQKIFHIEKMINFAALKKYLDEGEIEE